MSPILVCIVALSALLGGYLLYGRFLEQRVFALRDDEDVPSLRLRDDVDFAPTPRNVLWGHHFASIAGAAPILGPAMAIVWGWLPALLWIVVGVVFMGAAHDFGALVLSLRHNAKSVGALTQLLIGPRSRLLFLIVIFFLIWLVSAVFAFAIGGLFVKFPASILPVNLEIVVAIALGVWVYRYKRSLFLPSLLALVGLYGVIFGTASDVFYVPGPESILRNLDFWLLSLMVYAFVASSLPVWVLLQPRDLINSHQLVVGLFALFAGFFVSSPTFHAPALGPLEDLPALFPLLFVTVACGAISGFHGLVSSGTTSKQLLSPTDARPIGYGGMLAEASLAILSTLAVATGMMVGGDDHVWHAVYEPIVATKSLPEVPQALGGFVNGAATMLVALGLPGQVASTVVAVLVISFAATSLDTALRIQRLILGEIGEMFGFTALSNRWLAGTIACGSVLFLIYGDKAQGAKSLWPVFGATNQVFAAITLLLCALYLRRTKRMAWPYLVPAIVVMGLTFSAMAVQVLNDAARGHWLVAIAGAVIAVLTGWVAVEGAFAWRRVGMENGALGR